MIDRLLKSLEGNYLFLTLFLALIAFCSIFIERQINLSLWGDEIFQIKLLELDYKDINNKFLHSREGNYPFFSFIYKFFYDNFNFNLLTLANLNFLNLGFLALSTFIVRNHIGLKGIILYLSLIISSEYFLRQFIELRGIGFSIGLCSIFAACFFRYLKERNLANLILYVPSGLVFSCIHPFCGLLVCSCSFVLVIQQKDLRHKLITSFSILFPILILLTYSRNSALDSNYFHIQGYFQHIRNTGAFMVPLIATFIMGVFLQGNLKKIKLKNYLINLSPLIISFAAIYLYSFTTNPIFQARYFSYFYPFLCLAIIFLFQNNLKLLGNPSLFICIVLVVLLYGPRASIPYMNFKGIIEYSHVEHCNSAPIYINHGTQSSPYMTNQIFDLDDYILIEKIYSQKITRPLESSSSIIKSVEEFKKNFPDCRFIGATLYAENVSERIMRDTIKEVVNIDIPVHKKTVPPCKEDSCGVLWELY